MQTVDWNDLRYLLAVARAGTLAGAARRLAVDQTTVARRLAAAEAALGARLFDRAEGRLHPTEAGRAALVRAAEVEQAVEALERGVAGSDAAVAGIVRVTAVPILANHLLVPALPRLLDAHPGLRLELIADPRNLHLSRREADIALRLARPAQGTALARRAGRVDYAVYARRDAGAASLPWVAYEDGSSHLPPARWIAEADGGGAARLRVNDAETILQAVRAGIGRSLLPCFVGDRDPALRRAEGGAVLLSREAWLLVHPEIRSHARIRAVLAWIETLLPACRASPGLPEAPLPA